MTLMYNVGESINLTRFYFIKRDLESQSILRLWDGIWKLQKKYEEMMKSSLKYL